MKTPLRSLKHFLWVFILAVVLPGAMLGLVLAWWSSHQLVERQEQQARELAAAAAESLGYHLKTMTTVIAMLSQLPLGKDQFPDFYRVAKGFSEIEGYNITLADGDGNQFLSTRLPLGAALPHRDAMDSVRKAIISGHPHVSEVFLGKMAGHYVVTVDAPVSTKDGLRIITLAVDAISIATALSRTSLPEGWLMGLIDEHGVFIARSKDHDLWIGKPTRPELVDATRRSATGMIRNKSVEGIPILNVFSRVPGTDWTVLVGIPESVLYAPVMGSIGILGGLILIAAVLTTLLAFVFYRRLNLATAQLLTTARDPLRSDEDPENRNAFAEFEVVAQTLKTVATHQKQAKDSVLEERDRLAALVRSIRDEVWFADTAGQFTLVNPRGNSEFALGESSSQDVRKLAETLEVLRPDGSSRPVEEAPPLRALRGELVTNQVEIIRTPSTGELRHREVSAAPVCDYQGRIIGSVSVVRDITEKTHLEEALRCRNADLEKSMAIAEEANRAKSDFLASMSHELRTPLNAILGFAQLIESNTSTPPAQERSIDQILAAGWHLLALVNEILDLAQIESGKVVMSREAVSLENVMTMCQAMVEPLAEKRGIGMSFPRFDKSYFVDGDRLRIKQVLINLVHNAIKYNKPSGTVAVECTLAAPNSIRISVRDTGQGLAPEQLAQLFQPFNRLGKDGSAEQGTGIGLVVSQRLVELMGGVIGVESTVGVGSVFWIELNLTDAPPMLTICESGHAQQQAKPWPPEGIAQRTVLSVEDNLANLQLIEGIMERRPELRLISAADGNLGVEFARTHKPEVILMDLHLPGISGMEAMNALRSDPSTAHIPVIALSGYALPGEIERALDAGFINYLTKPIKVDEFMAALDVALEFSHANSISPAAKS